MQAAKTKPEEVINSKTKTVIELTCGKRVLVQGIIGQMAATKEWYYAPPYGYRPARILRNIILDNGKKSKQSLIRFLLSLKPGDGIRAKRIDKEPVISESGEICENYLTNNLKTNRK